MDKRSIADNFSAAAKGYEEAARAQYNAACQLSRLVFEHIDRPPVKIADIGCGTGALLSLLQQEYPDAKMCGLDIAGAMLDECRKKFPDMEFAHADAEHAEFGRDYSLITSSYCLQWTDLDHTLANICPRLIPGGMLALAMPGIESFPELDQAMKMAFNGILPGLRYYGRDDVCPLLEKLDHEVVAVEEREEVLMFDSAVEALRSFRRMGAVIEGRPPLTMKQVSKILRSYPVLSDGKASVTYRTLFVISRKI